MAHDALGPDWRAHTYIDHLFDEGVLVAELDIDGSLDARAVHATPITRAALLSKAAAALRGECGALPRVRSAELRVGGA